MVATHTAGLVLVLLTVKSWKRQRYSLFSKNYWPYSAEIASNTGRNQAEGKGARRSRRGEEEGEMEGKGEGEGEGASAL